jgi:molybdopterin-guanine dinucleotide biosynthesis protein A
MGRPKAELPVGDVTLLEWIVERLGASFAETIISGAPALHGATSVPDRRLDAGPIAGIESALAAMRSDKAFVLSCDMPRASLTLAGLLASRCGRHDAAVPRIGGRAQPTCAAYARSAGPKLAAYLESGERRATEALHRLDVEYVDGRELAAAGVAANELEDLDTPEDYAAFVASLRASLD